MKVSGFTFIRNAVLYDYPIAEAIRSILPLVDEMVVALGNSTDTTEELVRGIGSDKIRIIHTVWDDSLKEGGRVLAEETNKALDAIAADADWAFYIQGDEVVHEQDLPAIRAAMERYKDCPEVEGLLFRYRHFYGAYNYVGTSRRWYRHEIRIVRPRIGVRSYKDAQGFRIGDRKLNVMPVDAYINHYGWVKPPRVQQRKVSTFHRLYHSDEWLAAHMPQTESYDYSQIDMLKRFDGTHPAVMRERIARKDWDFEFDPATSKPRGLKHKILFLIERLTGKRLGEYKNFRLLAPMDMREHRR